MVTHAYTYLYVVTIYNISPHWTLKIGQRSDYNLPEVRNWWVILGCSSHGSAWLVGNFWCCSMISEVKWVETTNPQITACTFIDIEIILLEYLSILSCRCLFILSTYLPSYLSNMFLFCHVCWSNICLGLLPTCTSHVSSAAGASITGVPNVQQAFWRLGPAAEDVGGGISISKSES